MARWRPSGSGTVFRLVRRPDQHSRTDIIGVMRYRLKAISDRDAHRRENTKFRVASGSSSALRRPTRKHKIKLLTGESGSDFGEFSRIQRERDECHG